MESLKEFRGVAMIACFPNPYPDEIFYSICARYSDRMRYPTKRALSRDLFDCSSVVATVAFPNHLAHLVNNLPNTYGYSIDRFIDEHTFFPFFSPFLPQNRLLSLREAMKGKNGSSVYSLSNITTRRIPLPGAEQFRFCPVCINEDRNRWGECYWHRIHQIPGVEVCPMHKVVLCKISSDVLDPNFQTDFLSAERIVDQSVPVMVDSSDFCQAALLNIAVDIACIMRLHDLSFNQSFFKQRYLMLLTERGLARQLARVSFDVPLIQQEFKAYYPAHLLRILSCELNEHMKNNWLYRLLYKKDGLIHPLYHLLFIHFLGYSIETFVNLPSPQGPFGDGPWPCLNPVSQHYRQKVVYNFSISVSRSKDKNPKGVFSCECGFVYSRIGPDTCEGDSFKIGYILNVGSVWEETLRILWQDITISQVKMVQQLGLNAPAIQCHAARLGLLFPRKGSRILQPSRNKGVHLNGGSARILKRDYYRTQWLNIIQENPGIGSKAIRQQYPKIYNWLNAHDNSWQMANMPQSAKQKYVRKPRVDWNVRDKQAAGTVAATAFLIRNSTDTLERVTRAAILRHMKKGSSIKSKLKKLPLTRQVLDNVVESNVEFVIRQILWMRDMYLREKHTLPKRWLFAKQTRAEKYWSSPKVSQAFDAAMQSLEAFFTS